jgi:hypothetical protein
MGAYSLLLGPLLCWQGLLQLPVLMMALGTSCQPMKKLQKDLDAFVAGNSLALHMTPVQPVQQQQQGVSL